MFRRYAVAVLAILGVAALGVRAGDGWVDKDWHQWSKDEVQAVLHDSPWSKRWAKGQVNTSAALPGVSGAGQQGAAGEGAPRIDYYFQIRSAEPVREGIVRQFQLDQGYDTSMSAEQKKSFDDRAAQILHRSYDDVVVHVLYSSNIQAFERELAAYWQSLTQDSVKDKVYLITERGDRIPPNRFVSSRTGAYEFELNFPRTVNGEPLIRAGDKGFSIQFFNPAVGGSGPKTQSSGGAFQNGGARESKPGVANQPRNPLPPTGTQSTNPASHTVESFKAERVLVQFNVESMMWKGKLTY